MFSEVFLMSFLLMYIFLCTCDCDGLTSHHYHHQQQGKISEQKLEDTYSRKSEISEIDRTSDLNNNNFLNERGSFLLLELVHYLPKCPKSYVVTLENTQSYFNEYFSSRVNTVPTLLSSGSYGLCQKDKRIHFQECSEFSNSCGSPNQQEFIITDISRQSASTFPSDNDKPNDSINSITKNSDSTDATISYPDNNCRPTPCSTKQFMAINMKNKMDCGSFYICIMGQHFLLLCPQENEFSEENGVCLEKKYVNCKLDQSCLVQ